MQPIYASSDMAWLFCGILYVVSTPTPRAITREIARVIKGRMSSYNVTQIEMAQIVGVDQSQLSKMIRGMRQITIDQLDRMCHMLDLDIVKVVQDAHEFVEERDWADEPWIYPFVLDGERVSSPPDDEPTTLPASDEQALRKSDQGLAARRGTRK